MCQRGSQCQQNGTISSYLPIESQDLWHCKCSVQLEIQTKTYNGHKEWVLGQWLNRAEVRRSKSGLQKFISFTLQVMWMIIASSGGHLFMHALPIVQRPEHVDSSWDGTGSIGTWAEKQASFALQDPAFKQLPAAHDPATCHGFPIILTVSCQHRNHQ